MKEEFNFKLGEMYESTEEGYNVVFHAELKEFDNGEKLYYVTWEEEDVNEEGNTCTRYTVKEAKNAVEEGYWIVLN